MAITRRHALVLGAALTMSFTAACGSSSGGAGDSGAAKPATTVSDADLQNALNTGGTIKVWAWEPTLKQVVADFQAKYPKVKVDLVNAGSGNDQYTALQNAIKAGSGVPDVAQVEYFALPQFALGKSLADLNAFGADKLASTFTPGPWNSVHTGEGIYGLPMDSGPMALFYNKEVFDKHDIAVPTTWDEYVAAAEKLHKADPKAYITSDTGDAGFTTSMIWQAGGKPYTVNGTTVGVDFTDPGVQKFTATWQKLIDGKLLSPVTGWTDAWYKGLGDGTIATLVVGAWMPANLESGVKAASGKWRVAPMPQWEAGGKATAENGGSSLAIPEAGTNKNLAYAFIKYANVEQGVQTRIDGGAFPATTAHLKDPAFLNKEFPYFDGQKANEVLAASAGQVVGGWSYLPFQVYANSIFNDTVGKAYTSATPLQDALKAWQDASVKYGQEQGFTIQQ
ncbi:multiple sugar transport system substrate-binding protein [Streptosporangium becharense]|uniref:Multiple sugar transport system substrate-binding protein n=1 Tax=Streptosporangium becharense TaxID=1816182 RepID=A0A7W9MJ89_9ACTN|nr:sugar ABC transporter substrate-binding protein [Streptosporangium becharense]MBB2910259.1 multiple sugar transport system substrate-binding protein [Streptosporangium becharense]MBB5823002.1 multiple sugar transport system substrate-binding protein [Streptosporangium becharense]